jgi:hypothetical protein
MRERPLRFQFGAYVEAAAIDLVMDAKPKLVSAFPSYTVVPALMNIAGNAVPVDAIGIMREDAGALFVGAPQFTYVRASGQKNADAMRLGISGAAEEAVILLPKAVELLDRKPHRLSAVAERLYVDVDPGAMESLRKELLLTKWLSGDDAPFEWDWRSATTVTRSVGSQPDETLNSIVGIKRETGQIGSSPNDQERFDGIRVLLDINTAPKNVSERFGSQDVRDWIQASARWVDELQGRVSALLGRHLK